MSEQTASSDRADLLWSAQRALLGELPAAVVGVCVSIRGSLLTMEAFTTAESTDDRESLDAALGQMVADHPQVDRAELVIHVVDDVQLVSRGEWAILRAGYQVAKR